MANVEEENMAKVEDVEEENMANVEDGEEAKRVTQQSIKIKYDTLDYRRANAKLPWWKRIAARNWLSTLYATVSSVPTILLYWCAQVLVDAVSSDAGVRLSVWAVISAVVLEMPDFFWGLLYDANNFKRKAPHWAGQVVVWSASLYVTKGNLGIWQIVAVTWLGLVSGNLAYLAIFGDPTHVGDAGSVAVIVILVATVTNFVGSLVVAYVYIMQVIDVMWILVLSTGIIYPILTYAVRELLSEVAVQGNDESQGIEATEDVEKGSYIRLVASVTAAVHVANKVAIAIMPNETEFLLSLVFGLVVEVLSKFVGMCWLRNKVLAEEALKSQGVLDDTTFKVRQRAKSFEKAAHRHKDANDKKRYEFRSCYEQLGESVATGAAFGALIVSKNIEAVTGVKRLAVALVVEYLSDMGVWMILEIDGYNPGNVLYRVIPENVAPLIFVTISALTMVSCGFEIVAMNMPAANATGNATHSFNMTPS